MAAYDDSEDLERSGGIDVPELALGLSLIGLGAVLVFKALTRNRGKGPQATHFVPIDIKPFTRQGNQITANVVLNGQTPITQSVNLQYLLVTGPYAPPTRPATGPQPAGYLATAPPTMSVGAGNTQDPFTFSVGTAPAGTQILIEASDVYSTTPCWQVFTV